MCVCAQNARVFLPSRIGAARDDHFWAKGTGQCARFHYVRRGEVGMILPLMMSTTTNDLARFLAIFDDWLATVHLLDAMVNRALVGNVASRCGIL